jgi:hypothetical protein
MLTQNGRLWQHWTLTNLKIDSRSQYQTSEASKHSQIVAEMTSTLISPFQMASAVFGNSKPLLPLEANTKNLFIVFLLMAVILKAAFFIYSLFRRPWWRRGFTTAIGTFPLLIGWRQDRDPDVSHLDMGRRRVIRGDGSSREEEHVPV